MKNLTPIFVTLTVACAPAPEAVPETEAFECVDQNTLCATINVPENYAGEPRELFIGFYDTDNFNRPPDAQISPVMDPSVVPGEAYEFSRDGFDIVGDFYLYFVLYDVNGGKFIPESGIDYIASTTDQYSLDGTPLTLPALKLTIAE